MERFAGKVAVVTGASGGMGSAIIKELLTFNITVVGLDMNIEKLKVIEEEVSKNLRSYNGKFIPKKCDVSDDTEVRKIFQWIHENLKTVSIMINTAGVLIMQGQFILNSTPETFDVTFGTNAKGTLLCSREAANSMMKNSEPGHIINFCSVAGYDTYYTAEVAVYAASKHAVRVLTNALKREILEKRANIKVTLLSPGRTRTGLVSTNTFEGQTREDLLEPEDIAKACISILSTPQFVSISEYVIEPLYQ